MLDIPVFSKAWWAGMVVMVMFWLAAKRLILEDVWGAAVWSQLYSSALQPWPGRACLEFLSPDVWIRFMAKDSPCAFLSEVVLEQELEG